VEKDNNYCWFSSPFSFSVPLLPFAGLEVSCSGSRSSSHKVDHCRSRRRLDEESETIIIICDFWYMASDPETSLVKKVRLNLSEGVQTEENIE
jgi:hypothetical protein